MEKTNFNTSLKNIPTTNKRNYLLILIMKIEELLRRMKWKASFFLERSTCNESRDYYGFKNQGTAPHVEQLDGFEMDLMNIVRDITFHHKKNPFQKKIDKIVKEINRSKYILTKADKTQNFYKLTTQEYYKLLDNNITKNYKKSNINLVHNINTDSKIITDKLKISDRVSKLKEKEAYILLKDHKSDFQTKPTTRLINPTRQEIGKISKKILERINKQIKTFYKLNQWINTADTINWFLKIVNKTDCSFIQFDIINYYPSISKELFENVIDFATLLSDISVDEINIIRKCRNTVLICKHEQWTKSNQFGSFDVSMGSLDSAEVTDLVGLYILYNLTKNISIEDIGLYRDDGLLIVKNSNGQKCERVKKIILREMKRLDLKVEITSNIKIVNFLDVTFNLDKETYEPYTKDNANPIYVHPLSNHPKTIIKHIPRSIEKRISDNSSNEEIFNKHKDFYNKALKQSGYKNTQIKFTKPTPPNNRRKNRGRKIIWFTPPYNNMVKTKLGKRFLDLINLHFPPNNILHKIFNKNTLKLSYSCGENLEKIIKKHNNKILNEKTTATKTANTKACNCTNKKECPLQHNCQITQSVYQATISTKENPTLKKFYIGMAGNTFKERYTGHKCSFNNPTYQKRTSLSIYYWELYNNNLSPTVTWNTIRRTSTCGSLNSPCYLCLTEKLEIIKFSDRGKLLNKKQETSINCRHNRLHLLSNPLITP